MTHPELRQAAEALIRREAVGGFAGPAPACRTARGSAGAAPEPDRHREKLRRAVSLLVRQYQAAATRQEGRGRDHVDFLQPVQVRTEDGRESTLLSHNLSVLGIRVISPRSLLGQKLRVLHPGGGGDGPACLVIRVVWSCAFGDELFENGGVFLDVVPGAPARLRLFREGGEG